MEIRKKIVANVATNQIEEVEYEVSDEELALEVKQNAISNAQMRMNEIEQELKASDYKAIKYAEGLYTDEEYAKTKSIRSSLRDEYNLLELTLKEME